MLKLFLCKYRRGDHVYVCVHHTHTVVWEKFTAEYYCVKKCVVNTCIIVSWVSDEIYLTTNYF